VWGLVASALIALGGTWRDRLRFGGSPQHAGIRIATDLSDRWRDSTARLRAAAAGLARDRALIASASTDRDALPALFHAVNAARQSTAPLHALTVYVPDVAGAYRVLAWSDGPADALTPDRLANAAQTELTVVAPGGLGLRLVVLLPVTDGTRTIAIVAAERLLSAGRALADGGYPVETTLGTVRVVPLDAPPLVPGEAPLERTPIVDGTGRPLATAYWSPDGVRAVTALSRVRVLALAALPLLLVVIVAGIRGLLRRPLWLGVLVSVVGAFAAWLTQWTQLPAVALQLTGAYTALALAFALPVAWWWRGPRHRPGASRVWRALGEWVCAGIAVAALLSGLALLFTQQLDTGREWRMPAQLARLGLTTAVVWTAVALLAWLADRWRIRRQAPARALLATVVWVAPSTTVGLLAWWVPALGTAALVVPGAATAVALAGLTAAPLRRRYRRASQSTRLLILGAATVLPSLIAEPMVATLSQRALEDAIASVHGPATLAHPQRLYAALDRATRELDALFPLEQVFDEPGAPREAGTPVPTGAAFDLWSRTSLAADRLTSSVELFGVDGRLQSRFALNVPELGIDQSSTDPRCEWDIYGEGARFGAEDLRMLHAERGVCDAEGRVRGALVLHVIFDYRSLPYLAARTPYDEFLRTSEDAAAVARAGDIQATVYGWSRLPLFSSGPAAGPISPELLARLEQSRAPFWVTEERDGGRYRVFYLNDRAGIYALASPVPATFDQVARLAESAALASLVFVMLLAVVTVLQPLVGGETASARQLVQEVRTSFYRKLFLLFVLTAAVPVVTLALTFTAYMGDKLRSDVATEAISAVTIARRVLEDTIALQQATVSDDVMVWISRVINQDVNVYDGATLRATSQRDLFDAGILPERTPAAAYRAIALDRVPTAIAEGRAGPLAFLVAATPVPGLGRQAVLTVPLAPRQRAIEREIADLNRGVLLGAIVIILLAAGLGAWVAQRVADPVARLTRATRQIASGQLDVRIVADTADELRRLVTDFNTMAATLRAQRAELGRAHELKAWADMSRQVAHDIKNPLTPIQLAAEHLQRVHEDRGRPLGPVFDTCVDTVLRQVKLLRQIASEFSTFAASPTPTVEAVPVDALLRSIVDPYRAGLAAHTTVTIEVPPETPALRTDRILTARALTNLVENALQAMPTGGRLTLHATLDGAEVVVTVTDTGHGMSPDQLVRAFEPHFSTKTGGSGLGLANAKRNIESCGGSLTAASTLGTGTTMTVRLPAWRDARENA
jgi:signal transduction histidine kinase